MSIKVDIQKLRNVRDEICNLEAHLRHANNPDERKAIQKRIDDRYTREAQLSVVFTRTYLGDISRLLDRDARMRRIVKELMPRD